MPKIIQQNILYLSNIISYPLLQPLSLWFGHSDDGNEVQQQQQRRQVYGNTATDTSQYIHIHRTAHNHINLFSSLFNVIPST